jgi:predicted RNA binding protein YcfA (HicA-like mRNA interferase family)
MRLPRDLSGDELARALAVVGYRPTRQTGSHLRLTTLENGEHHVTIPRHRQHKIGTLADVVSDVAGHLGMSRNELADRLFG